MDKGSAIVNVGDLAQPATRLIEKISDAIGVLWEPRQIVRMAKAEAVADEIKTQSELANLDLQKRAMKRFLAEEMQKQKNIESIIGKSIPELSENAQPEDLDNDWLARFFDECKLISDEDLQAVWAKILAGEANAPGSFSKKLLRIVHDLDKTDAENFELLCSLSIVSQDEMIPFITEYDEDLYNELGLNYRLLQHFVALGLIHINDFGYHRWYYASTEGDLTISVSYGEQEIFLTPLNSDSQRGGLLVQLHKKHCSDSEKHYFITGKCFFTESGKQLSQICIPKPIDKFWDTVLAHWSEDYALHCSLPNVKP